MLVNYVIEQVRLTQYRHVLELTRTSLDPMLQVAAHFAADEAVDEDCPHLPECSAETGTTCGGVGCGIIKIQNTQQNLLGVLLFACEECSSGRRRLVIDRMLIPVLLARIFLDSLRPMLEELAERCHCARIVIQADSLADGEGLMPYLRAVGFEEEDARAVLPLH